MNMRTRVVVVLLTAAAGIVARATPEAQSPNPSTISEARYIEHVQFLASDALAGRGNGTPGLERAGQYIADAFRAAGLRPGVDGSWFQPFPIVTGLDVRPGNTLA